MTLYLQFCPSLACYFSHPRQCDGNNHCHVTWIQKSLSRHMDTEITVTSHGYRNSHLFYVTSRSFDLDHPACVTLQSDLDSPKIVRFSRFKRLGPLKKAWPTTWNGHLGDRTMTNALFRAQTPSRPVAMVTDNLKR